MELKKFLNETNIVKLETNTNKEIKSHLDEMEIHFNEIGKIKVF